MEAVAYDAEDGAIEDPAAFLWSSNWQGEVGRGPWLTEFALAAGRHTLSMTVTDGGGQLTTQSIDVNVLGSAQTEAVVIELGLAAQLQWRGPVSVTLDFPAAFVDVSVRLSIGHVLSAPVPEPPDVVGASFAVLAQGTEGPVVTFAAPFSMRVQYTDDQFSGADEGRLTLAYFDETDGSWQAIPSLKDVHRNEVTSVVH